MTRTGPRPIRWSQELCRAINDPADPNRHRYGCDVPVEQFPQAVRDFYRRRYGVTLAENQVVTTGGSKDAIAQFPMAVLNRGDLAIAPSPGYPTYNIGHVFAGATTHYVAAAGGRAGSWWTSTPSPPTSAAGPSCCGSTTPTIPRPRRPSWTSSGAVEFGRKHNILICHDNAYGLNTYDGYRSPSLLQVEGAAEVAVEFLSLSKAFSMTGWRAGAMVGNSSAVAGLRTVKENTDNGTLRGIQFAAAKALDLCEQIVPPINEVYRRRRDLVVGALNAHGWRLQPPKGTIYVWAPVPERYKGSSATFATDLLERTGVIVTPGLGYGQWGEGYFRISLTYGEDVLNEALGRIMEMRL